MKAVIVTTPGPAENLILGDYPDPVPQAGELLVQVHATALNRADLLQRVGQYPPPEGASPILGLEMAGTVEQVGPNCQGSWKAGDQVCALLPGGGYAEKAVIPEGMAIPVPKNLSLVEAAAIPEVFLTAYLNLFHLGGLQSGQTVLVHAAAGGVGSAAIQLVRAAGSLSIATAGSSGKLAKCLEWGASEAFNYKEGPFAPKVLAATQNQGVDLVLDFIGAAYWEQNLQVLKKDGKLLLVGTLGGREVEKVNLGLLLTRRLSVIGSTLRSRSVSEKIRLTQDFAAFALPLFADGRLYPVIDRVLPWHEVVEAHRHMEANRNIGKIVLQVC